jgi:hypothetical protein
LPPAAQRAALASAAAHTRLGGIILFTGGEIAGQCQGQVGPLTVHHYSLGLAAYHQCFADWGCSPLFHGAVENGAATIMAYQRIQAPSTKE